MRCTLGAGFALILLAAAADPTTQVYEVPGGAHSQGVHFQKLIRTESLTISALHE